MKKLLLFLIAFAITFLLAGCTYEENKMVAYVLENSSQNLVVSILSGEVSGFEGEVKIYDLYVSGDCSVNDFSAGDLLQIDTNQKNQISSSDHIREKLPYNAYSILNNFEIDERIEEKAMKFDNCQISNLAVNNNNIDFAIVHHLTAEKYFLINLAEEGILMEAENNCLETTFEENGILFIQQRIDNKLSYDDKVLYGVEIGLEQIKPAKLSKCNLGRLSPVYIDSANIVNINDNNIIISDYYSQEFKKVTVNKSCPILKSNNQFSVLYYGDESKNQGLYIESSQYDDSETFMFDQNSQVCQIQSLEKTNYDGPVNLPFPFFPENEYDSSGLYLVPEKIFEVEVRGMLKNYYFDKNNKKIFTDRPDPIYLIGEIVKGQTDAATYTVDSYGKLRWIKNEQVASRLYGPNWDSQIIWFDDSIIYTYEFDDSILE